MSRQEIGMSVCKYYNGCAVKKVYLFEATYLCGQVSKFHIYLLC